MIHLREQFWAVEVPEGANMFTIVDHKVRNAIDERDMKRVEWHDPNRPTMPFVIIPYGTWEIACMSKDAIEGRILPGSEEMVYHVASLLTSKGCDLNNNWLILKKQ